jgi:hypothetical protein
LLYDPAAGQALLFSFTDDARGSRLKEKNKLENTNAPNQLISGKADLSCYPCSIFTSASWVRGREWYIRFRPSSCGG